MHFVTGNPIRGRMLEQLKAFLASCGLQYDPHICFTAMLIEGESIIAAGSLDGNVIKCVAVSPAHQGEDLAARILTLLVQHAAENGVTHLMLYTKPTNQHLFSPLGFHPVIRTAECLLMENTRNGLSSYLNTLAKPTDDKQPIGCIVANCDPFTLGHRYLIETASRECAWVHLFILSEERSHFSHQHRIAMARAALHDLDNVLIHPSGPYMVSSSTFPTYFIKDQYRAEAIHCDLDIRLFGERIAPALGITRRYAGSEPYCAVTAYYNQQMAALLPEYGITFCEIPRLETNASPISASHVRELLARQQFEPLTSLLPTSVIQYLNDHQGGMTCLTPRECSEI